MNCRFGSISEVLQEAHANADDEHLEWRGAYESNVDVQEFMVVPRGFDTFPEALRAGVETYHALKSELKHDGRLGGVGDEGGLHLTPHLPMKMD